MSLTRSRTLLSLIAAAAAGAGGYALHAFAKGAPRTAPLVYRGTLTNSDGSPLGGTHRLRVAIYEAQTGGEPRCTSPETSADLTATRGAFAVTLPWGDGGDCSRVVRQLAETWIGVTVDGTAFPRTKVNAVPYALEASHANEADRAATADSLDTPEEVLGQVNGALAKGGKLNLPPPPASGGLPGYEVVHASHGLPVVGAGTGFPQENWRVSCPTGKKPLGGGCAANNGEWFVWVNAPTADGWVCYATNLGNAMAGNNGTGAATAAVYAICATP